MARELDTGGDTTVSLSHLTRRRASVGYAGDRRGPLRRLMGHVGVAPDQEADPRRVVMVARMIENVDKPLFSQMCSRR